MFAVCFPEDRKDGRGEKNPAAIKFAGSMIHFVLNGDIPGKIWNERVGDDQGNPAIEWKACESDDDCWHFQAGHKQAVQGH